MEGFVLAPRILFIGMFLYASVGMAQSTASGTTKATEVFVHTTNSGLYLRFEAMINPDGCTNTDFIFLPLSDPMFDQFYALMLAAYTTGKPVEYWVDGCSTGRPRLTLARLK